MLRLGGIEAYITVAGKPVTELRQATSGEIAVGFIEATDGKSFEVGFTCSDRSHDYSVRCVVDGTITSSRALCSSESERTSAIGSVAVTQDGSKTQPFVFASMSSDAFKSPQSKTQKAKKGAVIRSVGTIRVIFTRCSLQEVRLIGSEVIQQANRKDVPENATDSVTHFTKLGQVQYDAPRRAYKIISEHRMPWATMLFVYGKSQVLETISLDQLDLTIRPNPPRVSQSIATQKSANTLPTLMKIFTGNSGWGAEDVQDATIKPIVAAALSPVHERSPESEDLGSIANLQKANVKSKSPTAVPTSPKEDTESNNEEQPKPSRRKLSISFRKGTSSSDFQRDPKPLVDRARQSRHHSLD